MQSKEFSPYEQALELKELGFDEECICTYQRDKVLSDDLEAIKRKLASLRANYTKIRKTEPNLTIEEYLKRSMRPVRNSKRIGSV